MYLHDYPMHHPLAISKMEMHQILTRFYDFLDARGQIAGGDVRLERYGVICDYVQGLKWRFGPPKEDPCQTPYTKL